MPYDSSINMKPMGPSMHKGGPHMESAKQERSNLLHDNPVARDASGGRPWISKHFKSSMGSAMRMDHDGSPMSKHDGKKFDDPGFMDTHFQSGKPRNAAPEKKYNAPTGKHCMGKKN